MSLAHKGSRLYLKEQPISVEYETTHFGFDMDAMGISEGELVEPVEGSVYTHRKSEGRFNSAVAVEEPTTNIAQPRDAGWFLNKSVYLGTSQITTEDTYFTTSARFDFAPRPEGVTTGGWQVAQFNLPSAIFVSGNTYTASIYARRLNSDTFAITLKTGGGIEQRGTSFQIPQDVPIGEWRRYSMTWTDTIGAGTQPSTFYVGGPETLSVELADPQIEQKAFPTSFTPSTRANGSLSYPKGSSINPQSGAITMWFNPLAKMPNTNPAIFSLGEWIGDASKDWLAIYYGSGWSNANTITFGYKNGTLKAGVEASLTVNFQANRWYYIGYSWNQPEGLVYAYVADAVTGETFELSGDISAVTAPPAFDNYNSYVIGRGWGASTHTVNGMFSDIAIDRYALTPDEIEGRFLSNKALYNPYDYRAYSL